MWRRTFKMAAMTSFHVQAARWCSSVRWLPVPAIPERVWRQFLIYATFLLVLKKLLYAYFKWVFWASEFLHTLLRREDASESYIFCLTQIVVIWRQAPEADDDKTNDGALKHSVSQFSDTLDGPQQDGRNTSQDDSGLYWNALLTRTDCPCYTCSHVLMTR